MPLNRTILELKYQSWRSNTMRGKSLNRTILELKLLLLIHHNTIAQTLNRTILELKYARKGDLTEEQLLSIAPYWN